MKRPNGFPPPPPPEPEAPAKPVAPKSVRPIRRPPNADTSAGSEPTAPASTAPHSVTPTTIRLTGGGPAGASNSAASLGSASAAGTSAERVAGAAAKAHGSAATSAGHPAAETSTTAPPKPPKAPKPSRSHDDEALARKNMRIAERTRRRYERSEARRFTERARRRRITWLVSAGILVALIVVVVVTAYSPLFAVRTVDIVGTSRIDAAQVESALSDQLGKPLALVDYGAINRDLASFTLIQSYSTESQLPNTLVVRIVERQPVGSVASASGGGFDLVDPAGVVVSHSGTAPAGYPSIDLSGGPVGSPGFMAATAVLRALPADLLAKVASVSAATPDSVTLVLSGAGQKVVWGSVDNSALKAVVLDKLIATQSPDAALTYDVSSPDTPIVS